MAWGKKLLVVCSTASVQKTWENSFIMMTAFLGCFKYSVSISSTFKLHIVSKHFDDISNEFRIRAPSHVRAGIEQQE